MVTADDLYAAAAAKQPIPDETFAKAHIIMCLRDAAEELTLRLTAEYADLLDEIRENGLASDTYELRDVKAVRLVVDIDRARAGLSPEVFADIVHVGQSEAEKILSRRRLYELVLEAVGPERILKYQKINKADLEARLPAEEAAAFFVGKERLVRTEVVMRDGVEA